MNFEIPEDLKMVQTLARDFVRDQLIPLEREILGREKNLEGSKRSLNQERQDSLIKIAKDTGLWGLNIPEEFGGIGISHLGACLVEEEMAKTIIPFNPGDITPFLFDCNEEQKKKYLWPALAGEKFSCLALIEPGNVQRIRPLNMTANKENGAFLLNGQKLAFGESDKIDFIITFVTTDPSKGLREGVTCFLVDRDTPGLSISGGSPSPGWQSQVAQPLCLTFHDCVMPAKQVLGEEGKALYLGKKYLPSRRVIRAARCVGAAVRLLDTSAEHVKSWSSFGTSIAGWPHILDVLAEMSTDIQAARLIVWQAAWQADEGQDIRHPSAAAKLYASEMLERVGAKAVTVKGGPSPSNELPIEILCRSMLVSHVLDRSLDAQKFVIAQDILKLGRIT